MFSMIMYSIYSMCGSHNIVVTSLSNSTMSCTLYSAVCIILLSVHTYKLYLHSGCMFYDIACMCHLLYMLSLCNDSIIYIL